MTNPCHPFPDSFVAGGVGQRIRRRGRQVPAAVFAGIVQACDPVLLCVGSVVACLLLPRFGEAGPRGGDLLAALVAAWVVATCLRRGDAYRLSRLVSYAAQMRWLALALLIGTGVLALAGMVEATGTVPAPPWIANWLVANGVLLGAMRLATVRLAMRLHSEGRLARRVALIGGTEIGRSFTAGIRGRDDTDIEIIGWYDDAPGDAPGREAVTRGDPPFLGDIDQLVADGRRGMLDTVVIALPASDAVRVAALGDRLEQLVLDVFVAPDLAAMPVRHVCLFGGLPVGLLARRPLSDWQIVQKALFDRILAGLLLLAFAPALLLIALLIRLDSAGPALFRQRRIGFNNRPFDCLKFRTMYHHSADALAERQATRGDTRITRVGWWLRRSSLDELPQLLNVLGGEMSLVGPRPHAPNTRAASRLFQDVVAGYAGRHRVKPGITGWAQVNGWRGETATEADIEQRVRHDLQYIQNWSLAWDLRILLMTAVRVCADRRAF